MSLFFFFCFVVCNCQGQNCQKTQMMANYQELHLIFFFVNIFVNFHFCKKHFHTYVEITLSSSSSRFILSNIYNTILMMTNLVIYQKV